MDKPVQEIVQASSGLGIIPATLKGLKELNLSGTQMFGLLVAGMLCYTASAIYFKSKEKEEDPDARNTTGAVLRQDQNAVVNVEDINVNRTGLLSRTGNVTGLNADATDNATLTIRNINVTA